MKPTGNYNLKPELFSGHTKKAASIVAFAVTLLFSAGCGNKQKESLVAPEGMHVLDLSKYGKPFAIFVPDTVKSKLMITEQSSGSLDIKVGTTFAISINEQAADIELKKNDLKEDEVNKLKGFIKEEPNAILWESAITDPEFHFLINQKIANSDYSFEDIKDTQRNPFGKDAIQKMFDSCKSISEIKKENS